MPDRPGLPVVDEGPGPLRQLLGAVADFLEDRGAVPSVRVHFFVSHSGPLGPSARPRHQRRWETARRHTGQTSAVFSSTSRGGRSTGSESWVTDLIGLSEAADAGPLRWPLALPALRARAGLAGEQPLPSSGASSCCAQARAGGCSSSPGSDARVPASWTGQGCCTLRASRLKSWAIGIAYWSSGGSASCRLSTNASQTATATGSSARSGAM